MKRNVGAALLFVALSTYAADMPKELDNAMKNSNRDKAAEIIVGLENKITDFKTDEDRSEFCYIRAFKHMIEGKDKFAYAYLIQAREYKKMNKYDSMLTKKLGKVAPKLTDEEVDRYNTRHSLPLPLVGNFFGTPTKYKINLRDDNKILIQNLEFENNKL